MIGHEYWATGVSIAWSGRQWTAKIGFFDSGFCNNESTEGELRLRYCVDDIVAGVKVLLADADRLGIRFTYGKNIYVPDDGENPATVPANWRAVVAAVAEANGLHNIYAEQEDKQP